MTGEKLAFLGAGIGFCCLTAVLYVKRRWYTRLIVDLRFFRKDEDFRRAKAQEFEPLITLLLGRVFPVFMTFWLVAVAVS